MNDVEAIKSLVKKYQEAIHLQDKKEFIDLWVQDKTCSLISLTSEFIGLDKIYDDFLIGTIQRLYQKIDLIAESLNINIINENIAIVIFEYHTECIKRETQEEYGIYGLETQVVVKKNNEWKLLHIHYSKN